MMELAWAEELSVGNALIDSEHKNLIVMINNVERAIRARDRSALLQAFEQLKHCLCAHFANEEKIAQAIQFSFINNKLEHIYFLKTLHSIKHAVVSMPAKDGVLAEDVADYYEDLSNWLTNHIIQEDMLMKPVLQTYPYDFKPG